MLKKFLALITLLTACTLPSFGQSNTRYLSATKSKTVKLKKWSIPPGNYSGITYLGDNLYAVVSDKAEQNGFYIFEILISSRGKVKNVRNLGFRADSTITQPRDAEGIVYVPSTKSVFISAESDQEILEYNLEGQQTGRKLNVPEQFSTNNIQHNYGFEALGYSPASKLFWTTTENALISDKQKSGSPITLRIQSFSEDLQPQQQYIYITDTPKHGNKNHKYYAFGVSAITALPDSSIIVLERELYVPKKYLGASITTKLYQTKPQPSHLDKKLIYKFRTPMRKLSNYEGMCLGPKLEDGTQTLILINDSQNNAGNKYYRLKDRIKVILLKND